MATINLKDYYYWHTHDQYIEVSDEVAAELRADKLYEAAYRRRVTRNKAQYSLDCDDGIEYSICLHIPTPEEIVIRKERIGFLINALNNLPEIQRCRIRCYFIFDMNYREIGLMEGVDKSAVRCSVICGLKNMKKYLRKYL